MILNRIGNVTTRSGSTRAVAVAAAVAFLVASCGDTDTDDGEATDDPAAPADAPLVVATTTIWADVARNVACDGMAQVTAIVPAGADPHTFEPSLRDREDIGRAVLVLANGLDLEESLLDVLDTVAAEGVPVVRAADSVEVLEGGDGHAEDEHADEGVEDEHADEDAEEHADDAGDEHADEHADGDPHVWQDPTRVAAVVPVLADALVTAGLPAEQVQSCADSYVDELTALDAEIETLLASVPQEQRVLVTNHDSLAYFADRYGFEVLGTVIPSSSTMAETNPADLEDLARLIADAGVPAVFAETQQPDADAAALAGRVGDVAVVTLFTDALGEEGSGADTYLGMMRSNATAIADALG